MDKSFIGKRVLITGATSGIGRAIARELSARGASLCLSGRDSQAGRALVEELSSGGAESLFEPADVTDDWAAERLTSSAVKAFGSIDILINNAGIICRGTALDCSDSDWSRVMATNVTSVFRLSRAVLPLMIAQGRGVIVNIASDWGLVGGRNALAYCASKGAVVQMTRSMALDHARDGIRVLAVCPGDTDTSMLDNAVVTTSKSERLEILGQAIPMGRVGKPEEIARVVCFVASDEASFMTGAMLSVDGGNTAG